MQSGERTTLHILRSRSFADLHACAAAPRRRVEPQSHWKSVYDSLDSIFQRRRAEVQQKADAAIGQRGIGSKLARIHRGDRIQSLHFDDDRLFNYQVGSVSTLDTGAIVEKRQCLLCLEAKAHGRQLVTHAREVDVFEESGA